MFLALPSKDLDGKFEMLVEAVKEAGTTLQDSDSYRGRLEEAEVESLYDEPRDVHVPCRVFGQGDIKSKQRFRVVGMS